MLILLIKLSELLGYPTIAPKVPVFILEINPDKGWGTVNDNLGDIYGYLFIFK
jgi:hypothetical protein